MFIDSLLRTAAAASASVSLSLTHTHNLRVPLYASRCSCFVSRGRRGAGGRRADVQTHRAESSSAAGRGKSIVHFAQRISFDAARQATRETFKWPLAGSIPTLITGVYSSCALLLPSALYFCSNDSLEVKSNSIRRMSARRVRKFRKLIQKEKDFREKYSCTFWIYFQTKLKGKNSG